jgi:hypothetical protein
VSGFGEPDVPFLTGSFAPTNGHCAGVTASTARAGVHDPIGIMLVVVVAILILVAMR